MFGCMYALRGPALHFAAPSSSAARAALGKQAAAATAASFSTDATMTGRLLQLNDLSNIDEATKKRKRWGRGIGSGKGKTCGWGHQKSRSTPRAFEGGQTPLYKRLPKIGFHNHTARDMQVLNLDKVQHFIDMGRLAPKPKEMVTIRDLVASGLVSQVRDGVKLLAKGKEELKVPVHLEVSAASTEAIAAVEKAGGTVTCVHLNKLAIRALVKPYKFDILPHRARPPPRLMGLYLDRTKAGYLSPEIQQRNLTLFGAVTSEPALRAQHDRFMVAKRKMLWPHLQHHQHQDKAQTHGGQQEQSS